MSNLQHDEIQRLKTENAELREQLEQSTRTLMETQKAWSQADDKVHALTEQLEQATTRAEAAEQEVRSLQDCINPTFCIELAELRAYRDKIESSLADLCHYMRTADYVTVSADVTDLEARDLWRELKPSPAALVEREGGE